MQMAANTVMPAVVQNGKSGTGAVNQAATATGVFPQLLVQIVGDNGTNAQSSTEASALSMVGIPSTSLPVFASEATDSNLLELVEQITQLLQDEQQLDLMALDENELSAILEQLDSLIYYLSMMNPEAEQAVLLGAGSDATVQSGGYQAANTEGLLKLLSQLQTQLQQGMTAAAKQSLAPLVEQQLNALKQLLQAAAADQQQGKGKDQQPVLDLRGGQMQVSVAATPLAHLMKLSQSVISPNLMSVVAQNEAAPVNDIAAGNNGPEPAALPLTSLTDPAKTAQTAAKLTLQQPVPVHQFSETMSNLMVKHFNLTNLNGVSEARISLYPEHLGQVDIRISMQNGQLTATFMTENGMAKELLENQLAQLRSSLQSQGLNVQKLEVAQFTGTGQFQEGRQSNNGQQQSGNNGKSARMDGLDDSFEAEFVEEVVNQELGYGRGINVTA